jgi:hypothetical protein
VSTQSKPLAGMLQQRLVRHLQEVLPVGLVVRRTRR